jgi:hypothetical protein
VTAVGSETDEKADIEAGVNAASGDDGTAYELLRTFSGIIVDASKAITKRYSAAPILQGSVKLHPLLVNDNSINLKMLGMFIGKCGMPVAEFTFVPGG